MTADVHALMEGFRFRDEQHLNDVSRRIVAEVRSWDEDSPADADVVPGDGTSITVTVPPLQIVRWTPRSATLALFARYRSVLADTEPFGGPDKTSSANLSWMCSEALSRDGGFPLDKLSRWLGFVQGVLASRGLVDVDVERDFSRPMFHAAYDAAGIAIPPTAEGPGGTPDTSGRGQAG